MKNEFATERAVNISKKSAVKEHVKCKDHSEAEKLETARIQMESLQNQIFLSDANVRHIIVVMRAIYFLSKNNLPLRLLPSIITMMKKSEIPNISDRSITYTNEISKHEFLIAISKTIENEIWKELSDVVAFGIMIDETKRGIVKIHFLCLIPLTECDAESITCAIIDIFERKGVLSKLVVFASDGASVMLGKNEGVAAKLSRVCTYSLIVNHCVAHKLALACKDARKEIEFYKEAELLIKKFMRLYEICWLAWYKAIKNICNSIPALLQVFKEAKNNEGLELYNKLTSWRILAFLYFFYNILDHEYSMNDQSQKFEYNVQRFIDKTNPFENSSIEYMGHNISFNRRNYDEFLMDIYSYLTSIISELQ
ncbi:zinc finger protein 862-like [Rhizophagus irregularis DAOM 181602=DAOM 197198]|nr:zinc finger protein 862-like [Rhizophagus irregularis DAOM 181602=DAOM 197198]